MIPGKNDATARLPAASGIVVRRKGPRMLRPVVPHQPVSREAQRVAAAILEVLAGVRTPTDAAGALGMAVPRYYLWEQRALAALVAACEPRPAGQTISLRHQVTTLQKEVSQLKQQCARQQALVRATQRTVGLTPPASKPAVKVDEKAAGKGAGRRAGKRPRQRRPVIRALKAAAAVRAMPVADEPSVNDSSGAIVTDLLQRSVDESPLPAAMPAEVVPAAAGT